jgi:hypothetical protein
MAKKTFAQRTFKSRTFASGLWAGPGTNQGPSNPVRFVTTRWAQLTYLLRWGATVRPLIGWSLAMPVGGIELTMVRGEDVTFTFMPDVPTNITGWSIRWQLRATAGGSISVNKDNVGAGGVLITDSIYGIYTVTVAKADTSGLVIQTLPWYWEARRFDAGSSTALSTGTLMIAQENAAP